MAVTLAQASAANINDLQAGVVEMFTQESVILDRLNYITINGNAYAYNRESVLPGVAFRAVGAAYVESTGIVVTATETLKILGGDADVDRFIEQTMSNLYGQRAVQTRLKVKALSMEFQNSFFNGDSGVDANSFDGLKKRLTGTQVITPAANGIPVVGTGTTAELNTFFDQLDLAISRVANPQVIYANAATRGRILSALRRVNQYVVPTGPKQEMTYNGIPIVDPGTKSDGTTMILPQTETVGTSTDCTSIYVVGFSGNEATPGVAGLTNGGVSVRDIGEVSDKPVYRTRLEFYCGVATFGAKAACRLTGIRAS